MAATLSRNVSRRVLCFQNVCRQYSTHRNKIWRYPASATVVASIGSFICWKLTEKRRKDAFIPTVHAKSSREMEAEKPAKRSTTYREQRFQHFASLEIGGVPYMTPQDFLESITEESPRPRIGRQNLNQKAIDTLLHKTPSRSRGSTKLFRNLHNHGIISYTEYLFLLCVLTKPRSGFRIAFNMFDLDGNQIVDKREFLVLETFFTLPSSQRNFNPRPQKSLQALLSLRRIFSGSGKEEDSSDATDEIDDVQQTTLLIHFFGSKGTEVLKYDDFYRFMENLQSEVIEIEFLEFSKGMATISEVDFARILLRYTLLDKTEIDECIARVQQRIPEEQGITFEEFKKFCQFLNNLDDFTITMKMYTFAAQAVSQEEFQRAVKVCTGFTLGPHVVNTVFQIFDSDGDGHLSHKEFVSIMKDRLHRGARSHLMHSQGNWDSFKACVRNEMRAYR